jgi:hypothetical protein
VRRTTTLLLATALSASMLAFAPAANPLDSDSGSESGTTTGTGEDSLPAPIDVEMFLHGADDNEFTDDANALGGAAPMDRTAPEGDFESKQILNYVIGPNPDCTGNGLLPTWSGFVGDGTFVGDATLTFDVVGSTPGQVQVELWADQGAGACNEAYVEPDITTIVDLPAGSGTVEAAIDTDGFDPQTSILLVVKPVEQGPVSFQPQHQARMLYDGADFAASLKFTCQPDALGQDDTAEDADCLPF